MKTKSFGATEKFLLYCKIFLTLQISDCFIFEHLLCPKLIRQKFFPSNVCQTFFVRCKVSKILTLELVFVHEPTQAYNSDAHFQESRLLMNHLLKGQSRKEQPMLRRWTSSVLKPDSFRTKSLPLRQTKFKTSYTPFTLTKLV